MNLINFRFYKIFIILFIYSILFLKTGKVGFEPTTIILETMILPTKLFSFFLIKI